MNIVLHKGTNKEIKLKRHKIWDQYYHALGNDIRGFEN